MTEFGWILDDLPIGVWVAEVPSGVAVYVNRAFKGIMGQGAVEGADIEAAPSVYGILDRAGNPYPPERLPFSRVVASRAPCMVDDLVVRRPDGVSVNVRTFARPVFGPGDELTHVTIAFIDITREVEAERDRESMEARLRFTVNHAPIVIWTADTNGVVMLSEGAGLSSLGVESGQLVGQNIFDLYRDHPSIEAHIRRGLAGDAHHYSSDLGPVIFETYLAPIRNSRGEIEGVAGVSHDVTEIRTLQANAIQSDRIAAMGTLAASVAHEVNNPLTYVLSHLDEMLGAASSLKTALQEGASAAELAPRLEHCVTSLETVRQGAVRIAQITQELRTFSRPDDTGLAPVDLGRVVQSVLKLVAKDVEAQARLVLDLVDTPPVQGNEARLVQVVLNLVVNAMHAVEDRPAATSEVVIRTRHAEGMVILEVADSGPGVPAAEREHIFEAFMTTKDIGQGTGLGLFVSRNIVRALQGEIVVTDSPRGGALFRVTLPASKEAPTAATVASRSSVPPSAQTSGHVLIVDDDAMVGQVLRQQLKTAGFRVQTASDGPTALSLLLSDDSIDLIFCDLMMGGMTGMEFGHRLAKEAPEWSSKVVYMTGGAFTSEAREFLQQNVDNSVDKPFDIVAETRRRLARQMR